MSEEIWKLKLRSSFDEIMNTASYPISMKGKDKPCKILSREFPFLLQPAFVEPVPKTLSLEEKWHLTETKYFDPTWDHEKTMYYMQNNVYMFIDMLVAVKSKSVKFEEFAARTKELFPKRIIVKLL